MKRILSLILIGLFSIFSSGLTLATTNDSYHVKPYLVYPADKPMYPEYENALKSYLSELQDWYKNKVGTTFVLDSLKVVKSNYTYDTMRCDMNPFDATPSASICLNDPKRIDGNWPMYMNVAIHEGAEKWDEKTATLVFAAGGGGYATADKYPNDTGWAVVGDWVLEPISGKANDWGIPCKYSDGWQCSGGVPKGTPAHELGHALGLPHPDGYPGDSIMRWHGGYPSVGFLPHEVEYLKKSPFMKVQNPAPTPSPILSSIPSVPEMVYPQNGQTLDLEGAYMFKVKPVAGATGYLFGLFQNGVMVYENWRDNRQLSPDGEFVVWQSNPFHAKFKAGTVIVMIRAQVNNQWTDSKDLTITLKPRTLLPTPTPNPTPIGIGTTNPIGVGTTNPVGIGTTARVGIGTTNPIGIGTTSQISSKPYQPTQNINSVASPIKNFGSRLIALRKRIGLFLYRYLNR